MQTYECHWSSNDAYPFCFGAKTPQEFAENDCYTCPWYSEYWRKRKMKELALRRDVYYENKNL